MVAFLSDPAAHGVDAGPVERIETPGAFVFLAGERAVKIKRAVRYPYLDYSTLELRRRACEAEVALNRRTAPDLYLGAVPIVAHGGGLRIGGEGEAVEWAVLMRRFADDRLLDRVAEAGGLSCAMIRDLADAVAAFHAAAERVAPDAPWGGGAFAQTVHENLAALAERPDWFPEERLAPCRNAALAALARIRPLLDRRRAEGRVRRCHGDLHLRNIVLLDGRPTPFDAIEFSDRLAWIDTLDDVAFLLMDLDHRGLRPLAHAFFGRYALLADDYDGLAALPLFLADRAIVRAKVAATMERLTANEAKRAALRAEALAYFAAAGSYLAPPAPALVAVGGVSGSGKTSLAARLAPAIGPAPGALHLRTDILRKHLFGVAETERLPQAAYAPEQHDRVFRAMFANARRVLAGGHGVVLDGVFGEPRHRAEAEAIARAAGVPFVGIWLEGPPELLAARVTARRGDASDATAAVVARQLAADFGAVAWTRLACARPIAETAAAARRLLPDACLDAAPVGSGRAV